MTIAAIILLTLLAAFLLWKEAKRPAPQHKGWRLLTSLLAIAALAGLLLQPTYTATRNSSDAQHIVLLTAGYDTDSVDAGSREITYTTEAAISNNDIAFIPDLLTWLDRQPAITGINLYGYGLDTAILQQLKARPISIHYHAPATPAGFIAAGWPRQLRKGEWLDVQGQYHNPTGDSVRIVLGGVGTRFDSAVIAPKATQSFSLRCKPQHLGPSLYALEASSKGQVQASEKLPVVITAAKPMQVLVLNSSPDFDNKFLATWLHDHQYQVAVRSLVSQHKYSKQFLNQPATALQSITPALLQSLDVLITDAGALAALSPGEKATIRTQVQQGLGLILQVDSSDGKDPIAAGIQVRKQPGSAVNPKALILPAVSQHTAPVQPGQWLSIDPQPLVQPIVADEQGAIVAAATLYGAGKLVLNTINHTYTWVLGGHQADYARFWTALLQKAARRSAQAAGFQQVTALATVGQPVQITLEKATPGLPALETPDGRIALSQQPWLPYSYTGTWWPVQAGWQTLRQAEDSIPLYIFDNKDWAAAKATASIHSNLLHNAVTGPESASKPDPIHREERPVPPVIFWLVFLVCCSYLWWEEKQARTTA